MPSGPSRLCEIILPSTASNDLASLLPKRGDLAAHTRERLSRGGWANPDVLLVEAGGGVVVVKDFGPRPFWVRWILGSWITSREARAYRRLQGMREVPRLLGRLDRFALVLEYRPGRPLSRSLAISLPPGFMGELRRAVAQMHRRCVVHLDLRHRSNVLAGDDGHPVLLDFASAVAFEPGRWPARWLLPWLLRFDIGALRKWEARLGG